MKDPYARLNWRYWPSIKEGWLNVLARMPDRIEEFSTLSELVSQNCELGKEGVFAHQIPGLVEMALDEIVNLCLRAFYLFELADASRNSGFPTWSLVDNYQSSLFSARAILGLLGVLIVDFNGKTILVDIVSDLKKIRKNERVNVPPFALMSNVIVAGYRFDHKETWLTLRRVMSTFEYNGEVSSVDLFRKCIAALDGKDYARQRNVLSYKTNSWVFEDLVDRMFDEKYFRDDSPFKFDLKGNWFSVQISGMLYSFLISLLDELMRMSPWLSEKLGDRDRLVKQSIDWSNALEMAVNMK